MPKEKELREIRKALIIIGLIILAVILAVQIISKLLCNKQGIPMAMTWGSVMWTSFGLWLAVLGGLFFVDRAAVKLITGSDQAAGFSSKKES